VKGDSRKGATRKAKAESVGIGDIVTDVVSAVEREGAVPRAVVTAGVSRKQQLIILDALVGAGLELGAKFVRRPLDTQL
jgi:hypothetical protein